MAQELNLRRQSAQSVFTRQVRSWGAEIRMALTGRYRVFVKLGLAIVIATLILVASFSSLTEAVFNARMTTDLAKLTETDYVIVFGATATSGEVSNILRARLDAAVQLYQAKKIKKIIVSGDSRDAAGDEPAVMLDYLIKATIPETDVILDDYGNRTFDTCVRASKKYKLAEAILITQHFHMRRAMYTCTANNIEVQGYIAPDGGTDTFLLTIRDFLALPLAVWQTVIAPASVDLS